MKKLLFAFCICLAAAGWQCNSSSASLNNDKVSTTASGDSLPQPNATKSSIKFSKVIGWQNGQMPTAPAGFKVTKFADGLKSPRWIYVAPNGDVFVAQSNTETKGIKKVRDAVIGKDKSEHTDASINTIAMFRGVTKDGTYQSRYNFLTGLNQPFGMLILGDKFYVAGTDAVWQYPYTAGQTEMKADGKIILNLPQGGYNNHWTRNLLANADGSKIYVTVGSGSNVAEHGMDNEVRRANILQINPDGSGEKVYASGLRNPVGMGWAPGTNTLYTAVNERDELGDELVPDYLTSVKEGGFYGWPFCYYGQHKDPRIKKEDQRPDLVEKAIVPDVPLGSHTASLGLAFYDKKQFPIKYQGGAFIGQHGSWNSSVLVGYRVVFVPFKDGKPAGKPEDFLTGFMVDGSKNEVHGRPVGIAVLPDGSMLVADDAADVIWRVAAVK